MADLTPHSKVETPTELVSWRFSRSDRIRAFTRYEVLASERQFSGNEKEKTDPRPSWLTKLSVPPCASTSALAMASPIPVP